nr:PREDICTED: zinc finger protein 236-like [Linepithema humile]
MPKNCTFFVPLPRTPDTNMLNYPVFLKSPIPPIPPIDLSMNRSCFEIQSGILPCHSKVAPTTPTSMEMSAMEMSAMEMSAMEMSAMEMSAMEMSRPMEMSSMQKFYPPQNYKQFTCSDCRKGLSCAYALNRHKKTVCGKTRNPDGKWKCETCNRSYDSKGSLSRHLRNECNVPSKFGCIFCHRRFTQYSSLRRHEKKFHTEECKKIQEADAAQYELGNHLRRHNLEPKNSAFPNCTYYRKRRRSESTSDQNNDNPRVSDDTSARSDTAIFSLPQTNIQPDRKKRRITINS